MEGITQKMPIDFRRIFCFVFQLFYGHVDEISAEGEKEENNNNRIGKHMSILQGGFSLPCRPSYRVIEAD